MFVTTTYVTDYYFRGVDYYLIDYYFRSGATVSLLAVYEILNKSRRISDGSLFGVD